MPKNLPRIRTANSGHLSECIRLEKAAWPEWWRANEKFGRMFMKDCVKNKRCMVALADRKAVGFIIWSLLWNKVHLQGIYINDSYKRTGVGTRLLEELLSMSRKQGFREIISDSDVSNKTSITFHLRNGFKKTGRIKNNWDGEDSYTFSRKI